MRRQLRKSIRHRHCNGRGITRIEVLVIALCVTIGLAILAITIVPHLHGSRRSPQLADGTQLRGIAQSLAVAARENNGEFLTPSIVHRLPVNVQGEWRHIPGRGEIDVTNDTTANLYSMLITLNYVTPELVISPLERNPRVRVMTNYNWDAYDPMNGSFWDDAFQANLATESHVSYAHLLLWGQRKEQRWRDSLNPDIGVISSRGPKDGIETADSYTCDSRGNWNGHIITGDGSARWFTSLQGWEHIFRIDEGLDGSDPVMTFTLAIDPEKGPTIQHD